MQGPEEHAAALLSLLHDGDRCLAEARLSLRRIARLKEALHEEGGYVCVGGIDSRTRLTDRSGHPLLYRPASV